LAEALLLYEWPYNVRELLKLAELAKIRSSGKEPIDLPLLADRLQAQSQEEEEEASSVVGPSKASEARVPLTRDVLERLMAEHRGVISRVAEAAGRSRKHIRRLLVDFKLRPPTE
jgi:DNA-binding NtrC family response regulator